MLGGCDPPREARYRLGFQKTWSLECKSRMCTSKSLFWRSEFECVGPNPRFNFSNPGFDTQNLMLTFESTICDSKSWIWKAKSGFEPSNYGVGPSNLGFESSKSELEPPNPWFGLPNSRFGVQIHISRFWSERNLPAMYSACLGR
jgi:hypothetical protein